MMSFIVLGNGDFRESARLHGGTRCAMIVAASLRRGVESHDPVLQKPNQALDKFFGNIVE